MEDCRMTDAELEALVEDAKVIEWEEYVVSMGPRFYGPDFDDETGPWYWENK
jgi:hypothetical protein